MQLFSVFLAAAFSFLSVSPQVVYAEGRVGARLSGVLCATSTDSVDVTLEIKRGHGGFFYISIDTLAQDASGEDSLEEYDGYGRLGLKKIDLAIYHEGRYIGEITGSLAELNVMGKRMSCAALDK